MNPSAVPAETRLGLTPSELRRIVLEVARDEALADRLPVSANERTWAGLDLRDDISAWIIRWPLGLSSAWHDHGGPETGVSGAFTVLAGQLRERAWSPYGALTRRLGVGAVRSFGPSYIHEVTGSSDEPAISVHVYSPQLTSMRTFRLADGALEYVETSEPDEW